MLDWKCVLFLQTKASLYSPPSITLSMVMSFPFFFFFLKHLTGIRPLQCMFVTSKIWNHTANKLRFWPWRQTAGAILIPSFGTNSARQTIRIFFMLWIPEVPGRQRENLKKNTVPVPLSLLIYGDKKISSLSFLTAVWDRHCWTKDASTVILNILNSYEGKMRSQNSS